MYERKRDSSTEERASERGLKPILASFLATVMGGVLLLLLEYHSDWFQRSAPRSGTDHTDRLQAAIIVAALSLSSAPLAFNLIRIWVKQRHHMREAFSLAAVAFILSFTAMTVASAILSVTPWGSARVLLGALTGEPAPREAIAWSHWAFLIVALGFIALLLRQIHQQWRGLKSTEQHKREQRQEQAGLFIEGCEEARRLVRRQPPLAIYQEARRLDYVNQLPRSEESLSWRDQAKDLLELRFKSYDFSEERSWHDSAGCWVGRNVETARPAFLVPCHSVDDFNARSQQVIRHAKIVESQTDSEEGELIVMVQGRSSAGSIMACGRSALVLVEEELLDQLVDFSDYRREIKRRVEVETLPDSALSIRDVYVPSGFEELSTSRQDDDVVAYLERWLREPVQRHLALLGEYGQGKSTAALMLTYRLLACEGVPQGRVPILIELRGTSPRNLTPLQLLATWCASYSINPRALLKLHAAGRALLIFEGFDEMALVGDIEMRLKHFRTLWAFAEPRSKVLITGRPNFFLDEEEMKAALGIAKPVGDHPYCEALRLKPFDVRKIRLSLRNQDPTVQEQITGLASKHVRFADIVARPSLLHLVSVLWEREDLASRVEEISSAFIMDLFVRHSYRRQGLKEATSPQFTALTSAERDYFMRGIATFMAKELLPNQIAGNVLREVTSSLVAVIPDSVSASASTMAGETRTPLRLRLVESDHGLEDVITDVRACGLLVSDPVAASVFRFGHKSFMEYLFSAVVAQLIRDPEAEDCRSILRATEASILDVAWLPVSLEFLADQVSRLRQEDQRTEDISLFRHERLQHRFAIRLFNAIHGGRTFFIQRYNLLIEATITSVVRARGPSILLSPLVAVFLLGAAAYVVLARVTGSRIEPVQVFIAAVFTVSTSVFLAVVAVLMRRYLGRTKRRPPGVYVNGRLGLWNYLCRKAGIDSVVLHRIAGTIVLPWAKKQEFDYFFRVDTDSQLNTVGSMDME